ncbi:hypothetical protein BCR41DRAFT_374648 [Lobosporangium transversale]|uniref:Uncharacterized protein n=1 Tax=Lobosporangium transversale TaxID=64571 RepID=A0A1Y2G9N6_9FUNG|nr:hypothetical protein BCR41DRAFT_374648 [Lobosporangium transversale]ORZ04977.1 hypothetical protein BCR41DRAFT_374648 [Lobosporangium transversale]|eukprot:XP_021876841.1 hypothetical protein BCR41DRAFT_374648 [Lobosporangium transversale]
MLCLHCQCLLSLPQQATFGRTVVSDREHSQHPNISPKRVLGPLSCEPVPRGIKDNFSLRDHKFLQGDSLLCSFLFRLRSLCRWTNPFSNMRSVCQTGLTRSTCFIETSHTRVFVSGQRNNGVGSQCAVH